MNLMSDSVVLSTRSYAKAAFVRWVIFAAVWWGLTGGDPSSWSVGVPASILASVTSLYWLAPQHISLLALLRLLLFFLLQSLLGASDVSSRVMRRSMRIAPEFITYHCHLSSSFAQQMFLLIANLLPGTLIADLQSCDGSPGAQLTVHVLSDAHHVPIQLQSLEQKIATVFMLDYAAFREVQ